MLNIYPANKLETLAILLSKVIESADSPLFEQDLVITQSQGMRHWIHMEMANINSVSMNVDFQLPVQFFWRMLRSILGNHAIPEKSAFSREVLCWVIYDLLADEEFKNDPLCTQPTSYWINDEEESSLKRFQLAKQQADLFEQYLIYRPDWLDDWAANQYTPEQAWQAKLWRSIIENEPNHTAKLIRRAMPLIASSKDKLPKNICIFGLNALPPMWLDFLTELANHTHVHLFHLNPCVEYWGELQTEKQLAKWLVSHSAVEEGFDGDIGNPLLANYGSQGRDFLGLLPERSVNEIPVFTAPSDYVTNTGELSVLHSIQEDILNLTDAREVPQTRVDDSIVFTCGHSALREIQGLHDFLLHTFESDPSITPKDVVVMCPQIENYAPYIEAVFNQPVGDSSTVIPCSLSDRTLKNVEPMVEIFEQLLLLPDSRFQLSEIISYLRLPAIGHKFGINEQEINTIETWLQSACVHWGLNTQHKAATIKGGRKEPLTVNSKFTWEQGLDRLILGFAMSDQEEIFEDKLLLPTIEGAESQLLGKLLLLLEQLGEHASKLNQDRTPEQWHEYLTSLKESLFALNNDTEFGFDTVSNAIDELGLNTFDAKFHTSISLQVVRSYLSSYFAQPEPGHQFMSGKVTFCSMVPMRSIPFKVVCILGMNDGDFPRFDKPFSFDLMANSKYRKGDRSRRGDDRYLFLEALISARQKLYLSYQGNSVKDNSVREPSIIISELMNYLSIGYGWNFDEDSKDYAVNRLPLQPFSMDNYKGDNKSFDTKWFSLFQPVTTCNSELDLTVEFTEELPITDLVSFFSNPLKSLSSEQFNLYIDSINDAHVDSEPFASNSLDKYVLQNSYVDAIIANQATDTITTKALLSSSLPDTQATQAELTRWELQATEFSEALEDITTVEIVKSTVSVAGFSVCAELPMNTDQAQQTFYRMTSPKGKDCIKLWLHHLVANFTSPIQTKGIYYQENVVKKRIKEVVFSPMESEEAHKQLGSLISFYRLGLTQPLFAPVQLANSYFATDAKGKWKGYSELDFQNDWAGTMNSQGFSDDPLVRFFFEIMPNFKDDIEPLLHSIYFPMYSNLTPALSPGGS